MVIVMILTFVQLCFVIFGLNLLKKKINFIKKKEFEKNTFLKGWSWFKFNNLGLALGMTFKFYTSVAKRLKLKVRKWGLNLTFVEVTGEKLVWGAFLPPTPPPLPPIFSPRFQHKQWQIFHPTTTSIKTSENNAKFRKIKTKIWKDNCTSSVYT